MSFGSVTFLFYFLPLFLVLHALLPWRNGLLLVGSVVFYAWGGIEDLWFVGLTWLNCLACGRAMLAAPPPLARQWLMVGIGLQVALLIGVKYWLFLISGAADPAAALPLGVSFISFHALSYLIDSHRQRTPGNRQPLRLALYLLLFPQLIAGPIIRFAVITRQFDRRWITAGRVRWGLELLIGGLAMKLLLANPLAWPVEAAFQPMTPGTLSAPGAWLALWCFTLQIYFDFAGYSRIAMGLALLFGFRFPRNFRAPLTAQSLTEFWRRWHISLSRWFRDYLYIPLGGNRRGYWRTGGNLLIVFALCGLWHGANWTFLLWGLSHGVFLLLERGRWGRWLATLPRPLAQGYMLAVVTVSFALFRADSLSQAGQVLNAAIAGGGAQPGELAHLLPLSIALPLALASLAVLPLSRLPVWQHRLLRPGAPMRSVAYLLLLAALAIPLATGTFTPFLYFRF